MKARTASSGAPALLLHPAAVDPPPLTLALRSPSLRSSAVHLPTQSKVAVKRIQPFDHSMFCLRTLREIKLLRWFSHENIISILDIIKPSTYEGFSEVYLIQVSALLRQLDDLVAPAHRVVSARRSSWRRTCTA